MTGIRKRAAGFTLIEVLLATVLLAAGLALAFATLRSATAMTQRGEIKARQNEQMRAVEGFLRTHIAAALPMVFATDPSTLQQARFLGEPTRMRFVADLPPYLGRGGPHLYDLQVLDAGAADRSRMSVAFSMVQSGQALPPATDLPPETLAEQLGRVQFRYRGLDREGALGPWQEQWQPGETLPLQVSIRISDAQGNAWPELVVWLRQSEGGAGNGVEGAL
ncbi:prepilin-type N-terminal cleavage/methylation domain-containing protein [Pseudoxanthomonas dokdonensis]|uniref:General secretion pathway protein GspJ n=1 Tax=Pseudoxanthomonas dokdonensis TaxID=344882 RepID=A0A0R0CU70_9GAMM|nr:prepilin-type N-terminal cleavage/methylation domain-containing protein [Pseudoxanthomonas dokdonensis]KRG69655.1 general secretion pathway protein GspJ [Pseudoxanthomonas dokdonensis]